MTRAPRLLPYCLALLIGLLAVAALLPVEVIAGSGGLWAATGTDQSQNLSGHLAFQPGPWRWPLLVAENLFWPQGLSIAMTDSNPLASLLAKGVAAPLRGHPVNLLGAWVALCFLLQPVAAVYALRGFRPRPPAPAPRPAPPWRHDLFGLGAPLPAPAPPPALPALPWLAASLAAAALSLLWPALLFRIGHVNLLGHFCLLLALGLAARALRGGGAVPLAPGLALLVLSILTHPYTFLFAAAVLLAPLLRRHPGGWRGWLRGPLPRFLAMVVLPVLLFRLLSGGTGGGDRGYGVYSMNLLSPVWPQLSGLFGGGVLDSTGGQAEGFNYLGAGVLLLLAAALALGWWRHWRPRDNHFLPLLLVLGALAAVAVTPRVYAGPWLLLPLPAWPWDQLLGIVRASGRAFWPVGYALMLAPLAFLATRLPPRALLPLLALAVGLQALDALPLLRTAHQRLARGEPGLRPLPALPAGMTLLRIAPACPAPGEDASLAERSRLVAVRQGAALADIRASRQPRWFNCEAGLSDALEAPLAPGEVRLLIAPAIARLRVAALGEGAACARQDGVVLCARGLPLAGEPMPPGPPLPPLSAGLPALLSEGWTVAQGAAWSEGPRASLLFRNDGPPAILTLPVQGIGRRPGEPRAVELRVNGGPPLPLQLPDGAATPLAVPVPAGPVRLTLDLFRPVDPARRGLDAPVRRAGLRLDLP